MRPLRVLPAIALALSISGCAGAVTSPDLFLVHRSGSSPQAHLSMLVNEEGGVRCNGGHFKMLSDPQIIKARQIQEELEEPSANHLVLEPQPGSVLRYRVRDENGSVSFADNSKGQPKVLRELAYFVLQAAQQVCHLPE